MRRGGINAPEAASEEPKETESVIEEEEDLINETSLEDEEEI